jgi:hypothetical protein
MADRSEEPPSGQAAPIERQGPGKESVPPETNTEAPTQDAHNMGECPLCTRYAARLFKRSRRDTYVSLLVATLTAVLNWRTLVELRDPTWRILTLAGLAAWLLCCTSRRYLARHARLLLTPQGIAYRSPLPSFLQWLLPTGHCNGQIWSLLPSNPHGLPGTQAEQPWCSIRRRKDESSTLCGGWSLSTQLRFPSLIWPESYGAVTTDRSDRKCSERVLSCDISQQSDCLLICHRSRGCTPVPPREVKAYENIRRVPMLQRLPK